MPGFFWKEQFRHKRMSIKLLEYQWSHVIEVKARVDAEKTTWTKSNQKTNTMSSDYQGGSHAIEVRARVDEEKTTWTQKNSTTSSEYQGSHVIEVRARGNSSPAFRICHVVFASKLAVKLRSWQQGGDYRWLCLIRWKNFIPQTWHSASRTWTLGLG